MENTPDNNWYAVALSKELKNKPIQIELLGMPIVLFRKDGEITALLDRCPHRNAPLSCGKITTVGIQCPYHGWVFDTKGHCINIPGMVKFQERHFYNVPSYSTYELGGIIWVSTNNIDATPYIPAYFGATNFMHFTLISKAEVSLLNALENFLDGTHTNFVHAGLIRKEGERQKITAEAVYIENGIEIHYTGEDKQSGIISKWFEGNRVKSIARFTKPNIAELEYYDAKGLKAAFFVHFIPENINSIKVIATVWIRKIPLISCLIKPVLFPFIFLALKQDQRILALQQQNIEKFNGQESMINTHLDIIRPYLKLLLRGEKLEKFANQKFTLYL